LIRHRDNIIWLSTERNIKLQCQKNRVITWFRCSITNSKDLSYAKFDEAVDVAINLGIDPAKGEQTVRGSVVLPYSKGKEKVIIVFAKGEYADAAKKQVLILWAWKTLLKKYKVAGLILITRWQHQRNGRGWCTCTNLGPRGLLPNKKVGTVTFDVELIVADLKRGRAFFRNDKQGIIHFSIGKVSFDVPKLHEI